MLVEMGKEVSINEATNARIIGAFGLSLPYC